MQTVRSVNPELTPTHIEVPYIGPNPTPTFVIDEAIVKTQSRIDRCLSEGREFMVVYAREDTCVSGCKCQQWHDKLTAGLTIPAEYRYSSRENPYNIYGVVSYRQHFELPEETQDIRTFNEMQNKPIDELEAYIAEHGIERLDTIAAKAQADTLANYNKQCELCRIYRPRTYIIVARLSCAQTLPIPMIVEADYYSEHPIEPTHQYLNTNLCHVWHKY